MTMCIGKTLCSPVVVSDGVAVIPEGTQCLTSRLYQNHSLKSITFNAELEKIGNACFKDRNITGKLEFPENLRSIGGFAFEDCDYLETVVFLEGFRIY